MLFYAYSKKITIVYTMVKFIIPFSIVAIFFYAFIKKVRVYDTFCHGAKSGIKIIFDIFPNLVAICLLLEIFDKSGLQSLFCSLVSPLFNLVGIPEELAKLVFLRPFSGSATTAIFQNIVTTYGVDSYLARCSATIMGSSETIFYVTAVYFSKMKLKNLGPAIPISLACSTLGAILSCVLCRVM